MANGDIPGLLVTGKTFAPNSAWIVDIFSLEQATVLIDHNIADATLPATYPSDVIRSGLVLGKVTASGKYKQYDDAASDGTQAAKGILLHPMRMNSPPEYASALPAGQAVFAEMVIRGYVDSTYLLGCDAAAIVDLKALGFKFKDSL